MKRIRQHTSTLDQLLAAYQDSIALFGELRVAAGDLSVGKTEIRPRVNELVHKIGSFGLTIARLAAQYRPSEGGVNYGSTESRREVLSASRRNDAIATANTSSDL